MNNSRLFQAIVVLGAALTGGCGGRDTGGITNSYYETDGGLSSDGGVPSDGGLPSDGGVPSDGGLPSDGGEATDGGEHEFDDGGWHTTK